MILLSFQPRSLERRISKINYLDIFISETGNKWNTTISRVFQTHIIYFMQPVTSLRFLKEVYFTVSRRSSRICGDSTAYMVKMDYLMNKFREKGIEGRTRWSSKLKLKDKIGKVKHSQVRKQGEKSRHNVPFSCTEYLDTLYFWENVIVKI